VSGLTASRNNPLTTAVSDLRQVFPSAELEIERVDVDGSGFLQLTAATPEGERWFTHDDRGLVERKPLSDTRIPLSEKLSGASAEDLRTVSYRPGRRMVIEERHNGVITMVLKGYRRRKSTPAALNHRVAEEAMESGSFRIPRLLRHELELETLVFEYLDGDPFLVGKPAVEICFKIGTLLTRFQGLVRSAELKKFQAEDEFGVLDTWRSKSFAGTGALPKGWDEARRSLDEAHACLSETQWGLCHRDLHDGQILLVNGEPALMDFDLLCQADTALDPANLLAHFSLRSLQCFHGADDETVRACGEAILDGLDRRKDGAFWNRLRFYQGTAFLRLALVYALRPKWSKLSEPLVKLGKKCLEEQIRNA